MEIQKYFIKGKEIVETENIPTRTELQRQFAQYSPDGEAIAPYVKIIDFDHRSQQRSFSEHMEKLIDFFIIETKGKINYGYYQS